MTQSIRQKILIIGFDFQILHTYYRTKDQSPNNDIQGFVYIPNYPLEDPSKDPPSDPPITLAKSTTKTPIRVIPLRNLENAIHEYRITKCLFQAQNIPMKLANSIINRITACNCSIEFHRCKDIKIKVNKPTIVVSAIAHSIGKTQVCRYLCDVLHSPENKIDSLRVAVIFPITEIRSKFDAVTKSKGLSEDNDLHFELKDVDEIPKGCLSIDDQWQIKQYLERGIRVFATSDVRKAVISAEQFADLIFVDSRKCEFSYIDTQYRLCIITENAFYKPGEKNLWPGLLNLNSASEVVLISSDDIIYSETQIDRIRRPLQGKPLYYVQSSMSLDIAESRLFDHKTVVIEHEDTQGKALRAANSCGADLIPSNSASIPCLSGSDSDSEDYKVDSSAFSLDSRNDSGELSPLFAEGLPGSRQRSSIVLSTPRASSPLVEEGINEKTDQLIKDIVDQINQTDAEFVVCSLQRDIEALLEPGKTVVTAMPEIQINEDLKDYLVKFIQRRRKAPLQDHFSAQVDIIMAMAQASKQELYVSNNDSANREAFCRIFLSSHIPPGFRVTTGEIIDARSNITGQLDVVVVNDSCPSLTIDSTNSIIAPILADNVLCTIEVKTSLTSDQLKKALNQMRPVKALMPSHSTLLTPSGKVVNDPLCGKIITGIFSFNKTDEIESEIEYILSLFPGVVDFVVIPDSFGYFWNPILQVANLHEESVQPDSNNYVKVTKKGMGLGFMFGILNTFAAIRRFSGSNCLKYLHGCWGDQSEQAAKNLKHAQAMINNISKSNYLTKDVRDELYKKRNTLIKSFQKMNNKE